MNKRKSIGYLLAMLAIGAVFFAALGALVNWRIGSPLAASETGELTFAPPSEPVAALREGLRQSVTIAWRQLERGHRTQAVKAIDAAKRAADVGRSAAVGELAATFTYVYRQTEHARTSLQDGQPRRAEQILAQTAAALALTPTGRPAQSPGRVIPVGPELRAYGGAHLLNAQGVRIGEVERAEEQRVTLRVGGNNDVLGFIDVGSGQDLVVPADRLVYGKHKGLGSTMVVLPVFPTAQQP